MKLILAGIMWIYIVLWVGSFLAFYPGIPSVLAVAGAMTLGSRYVVGRRRRATTTVETAAVRGDEPSRDAPAWSVLPKVAPDTAAPTTRRTGSFHA